jgi:hypothetical protein
LQQAILTARHLGMKKEVGADLSNELYVISYFCKDVLARRMVSISLAPSYKK